MTTGAIAAARAELDAGRTRARDLLEACLARIADPGGEGARTFTRVHADAARAEADAADLRRRAGLAPRSPLDGIPISVKDLFDVAGETTTAGTRVLEGRPAATADARIVARLRRAGAVIVGKTTMSEFAYTGVGHNPHHGTPANPWDRASRRIPGGSSSGAAVSVADGMALGAIGTDTGGSVRIPAALCGLAGYKPTQARVPRDGCFPLSDVLDSIGPLARTAADCVAIDRVLAGVEPEEPAPAPLAPEAVTLVVPTAFVFDGADRHVLASFDRAVGRLVDAGVRVVTRPVPALSILMEIGAMGGFTAAEAWAARGALVEREAERCDPYVLSRIRRGATITGADWVRMTALRARMIAETWTQAAGATALALPTCPIVAPPLAELLADMDAFARTNLLLLRNTSIGNHLDACSISIPCHAAGDAPAGLMLIGPDGTDDRLQAAALTVERVVAAG